MKIFKSIIRGMLFLLVLGVYYVICLGVILIRGNKQIIGDNMVFNILMLVAVASPFLVVSRLIKFISPGKDSRAFRSSLGGIILVGCLFHYVGLTQVDKIQITPDYLPSYTFNVFLAICLIAYKPAKSIKQEMVDS